MSWIVSDLRLGGRRLGRRCQFSPVRVCAGRRLLVHALLLNRSRLKGVVLALEATKFFFLIIAAGEEEQGRPKQDETNAHGPGVVTGLPALLSSNFINPLADADQLYSNLVAVVALVLQWRNVGRRDLVRRSRARGHG